MRYGSVIFDMDGVILDFTGDNFSWKYEAVERVLERRHVDPSEVTKYEKDVLLGGEGVKILEKTCQKYGLATRKVWEELAKETSKARAVQIKNGRFDLYPGVRETLEELKAEVQMALISNAPETAVRETINFFDLKSFFEFYRGIEDFEDLSDRKPHPDHLNFARVELKREPFLYVGDMNHDVEAARKADMDAALVKREYTEVKEQPDYMLDTVDELIEVVRGQ